jgi:hypothetical protein
LSLSIRIERAPSGCCSDGLPFRPGDDLPLVGNDDSGDREKEDDKTNHDADGEM